MTSTTPLALAIWIPGTRITLFYHVGMYIRLDFLRPSMKSIPVGGRPSPCCHPRDCPNILTQGPVGCMVVSTAPHLFFKKAATYYAMSRIHGSSCSDQPNSNQAQKTPRSNQPIRVYNVDSGIGPGRFPMLQKEQPKSATQLGPLQGGGDLGSRASTR